ncbi:MAG: HAD family hydrolase [Desulfovibrionales bacterium]
MSKNARQFKAVLFDLDGTLLDTLKDMADSMNRVLRENGFPEHPVDNYRFYVGDGSWKLVFRALPEEHRDDATVERCLEAYKTVYAQHWAVATRPYPGVAAMLDGLAGQGVKTAVFTNKYQGFAEQTIERFLPGNALHPVVGIKDGTPHKPDPLGALAAAKTLGFAPGEFLYLGDSGVDMLTATRAGMYPVGALWGFRPEQELRENGAQTLIRRPEEMLDFFRR